MAQWQLVQRKTISLTIFKSLHLQVGLKHLANSFLWTFQTKKRKGSFWHIAMTLHTFYSGN